MIDECDLQECLCLTDPAGHRGLLGFERGGTYFCRGRDDGKVDLLMQGNAVCISKKIFKRYFEELETK